MHVQRHLLIGGNYCSKLQDFILLVCLKNHVVKPCLIPVVDFSPDYRSRNSRRSVWESICI